MRLENVRWIQEDILLLMGSEKTCLGQERAAENKSVLF